MNNVILVGRLANSPELSYTQQNHTPVCRFTLAVSRRNREDPADFIRIVVWGKPAENCTNYLAKGRQVAVNGQIRTGSYTKNDGSKVYTTEVHTSEVEFLGSNAANNMQPNEQASFTGTPMSFEDMPDSFEAAEGDIPF